MEMFMFRLSLVALLLCNSVGFSQEASYEQVVAKWKAADTAYSDYVTAWNSAIGKYNVAVGLIADLTKLGALPKNMTQDDQIEYAAAVNAGASFMAWGEADLAKAAASEELGNKAYATAKSYFVNIQAQGDLDNAYKYWNNAADYYGNAKASAKNADLDYTAAGAMYLKAFMIRMKYESDAGGPKGD